MKIKTIKNQHGLIWIEIFYSGKKNAYIIVEGEWLEFDERNTIDIINSPIALEIQGNIEKEFEEFEELTIEKMKKRI